jgi:membrane protein YdbS with pleckstrin-like domain
MNTVTVARDGQELGSYSESELPNLVAVGALYRTDYYWQDGMPEWRPLADIIPVPRALAPPPPVATDPNEVMWEGRPHSPLWRKLVVSVVLAVTVVGILFIQLVFIPKPTRYRITRKRLIIEHGYFSKSSNEIRIQDIRNINLVGKSLLYGTATLKFDVAGSDGAEIVFRDILVPEQIRDLIRELQ